MEFRPAAHFSRKPEPSVCTGPGEHLFRNHLDRVQETHRRMHSVRHRKVECQHAVRHFDAFHFTHDRPVEAARLPEQVEVVEESAPG